MKRYLQLDALRGLFLIIMTLDHFEGFLRKLIYEKIGFVTAAEGFIFLSGIVAGLVYGRYLDKSVLFGKSLKRLQTIYRYHLLTVLIFFALISIVPLYHDSWKIYVPAFANHSLAGFISAVLLIYQPYFTDILPLYIVLIALMPFMIILLQQKRNELFWGSIFFLWFIGLYLGQPDNKFSGTLFGYLPVHLGNFNILCWQLIFFIGLYFGFRKQQDVEYATKLNRVLLLCSVFIVGLFFVIKNVSHLWIDLELYFTGDIKWFHFVFNKFNLGIGRIINFLAISYIVSIILRKYTTFFRNDWLVVLGQNSIKVYAAHLVSLFFFYPMIPMVEKHGVFWQVLFSLSMILPLYVAVIKDLPYSNVQKKRSENS